MNVGMNECPARHLAVPGGLKPLPRARGGGQGQERGPELPERPRGPSCSDGQDRPCSLPAMGIQRSWPWVWMLEEARISQQGPLQSPLSTNPGTPLNV